jgi:hypothetical protein
VRWFERSLEKFSIPGNYLSTPLSLHRSFDNLSTNILFDHNAALKVKTIYNVPSPFPVLRTTLLPPTNAKTLVQFPRHSGILQQLIGVSLLERGACVTIFRMQISLFSRRFEYHLCMSQAWILGASQAWPYRAFVKRYSHLLGWPPLYPRLLADPPQPERPYLETLATSTSTFTHRSLATIALKAPLALIWKLWPTSSTPAHLNASLHLYGNPQHTGNPPTPVAFTLIEIPGNRVSFPSAFPM